MKGFRVANRYSKYRFGGPATYKFRYTLVEWASRPEVQQAWKEISKKYNLESDPISNEKDRARIFAFADAAILSSTPLQFKSVMHDPV